MTVFARRRLQAMLDELAPRMTSSKGKDLVRRLNHKKDVGQALPAEMELALLWGISQLGDIDVEPEWWADNKRPDAVTRALIPNRTVAIEIAAVTDNTISGEEAMDAILSAADPACETLNALQSAQYGDPLGPEPIEFRLTGSIVGKGDQMAEDGNHFPMVSWAQTIDAIEIDDSRFSFTTRSRMTPSLAPGFEFDDMQITVEAPDTFKFTINPPNEKFET